jgi:hypothetical protein
MKTSLSVLFARQSRQSHRRKRRPRGSSASALVDGHERPSASDVCGSGFLSSARHTRGVARKSESTSCQTFFTQLSGETRGKTEAQVSQVIWFYTQSGRESNRRKQLMMRGKSRADVAQMPFLMNFFLILRNSFRQVIKKEKNFQLDERKVSFRFSDFLFTFN